MAFLLVLILQCMFNGAVSVRVKRGMLDQGSDVDRSSNAVQVQPSVGHTHTVFVRALSTFKHIDAEKEGSIAKARWEDHAGWQQFKLEKKINYWQERLHLTGKPIYHEDLFYLKTHQGYYLSADSLGAKVKVVPPSSNLTLMQFQVLKKDLGSSNLTVKFGEVVYLKVHTGSYLGVTSGSDEIVAGFSDIGPAQEFMFEDKDCSPGCCADSLDLESGPLGSREETLKALGKFAQWSYEFNGHVALDHEVLHKGEDCYKACGKTGPCEFCGTGGLCCRHPGFGRRFGVTHTQAYAEKACFNKGAKFQHVCVSKSYDDNNASIAFSKDGWSVQYGVKQEHGSGHYVQALAFTNPDFPKVAVIAYRGTQTRLSLIQDLTIGFVGPTGALWEARQFAQWMRRELPGHRLYVTGHSLGGYISQVVASYEGIEGVAFNAPGPVGQLAGLRRPRFEVHLDAHDPLAYLTFPGFNYSISTWLRFLPYDVDTRHIASLKWYTNPDYGGCHGCCGPYYGSPEFCHNYALKAKDLFCAHRHNSALSPAAAGVNPPHASVTTAALGAMSPASLPVGITAGAFVMLAQLETSASITRSMQGLPEGLSAGSLIQVEPGEAEVTLAPNVAPRAGESKQMQQETRGTNPKVHGHEPALIALWLALVLAIASILIAVVGACFCSCVFCVRRMC
jgi:pimeloyl-ACP methyl ester carboxylesterase